ncbi:MAG TPA: GNA1162 family protein [Planctomycetota bacterium]
MARIVAPLFFVCATAACASRHVEPPVYLNMDVSSVVVLPPFNETITEDAWKTAWPHLIEAVRRRGYNVRTKEDVEAFYRKNKFNAAPEEVNLYSAQELAKELNADAVLYSNIVKWGYTYVGVYSEYGVALELRLVDGKTGDNVWQGKAEAAHKESIRGQNGVEAIFSLFAVAGNAFLRSSDAWARDCLHDGLRKLPLAGYAPGTNPPPPPSNPDPKPKGDSP